MSSTSASTSSQRGKLLAGKKAVPQSNPAAAPKSLQALVCLDLPCENRENAASLESLVPVNVYGYVAQLVRAQHS